MRAGSLSDGLVVEDHEWPLVLIRLPAVMTVDAVRAFCEATNHVYDRRERFVIVVDTSAVNKTPDAAARRALTDWLSEPSRVEKERAYAIATAVVLPSAQLRAITAAIMFVRPPLCPQHWTATLPEAVIWARERLTQAQAAKAPAGSSAAPPSSGKKSRLAPRGA